MKSVVIVREVITPLTYMVERLFLRLKEVDNIRCCFVSPREVRQIKGRISVVIFLNCTSLASLDIMLRCSSISVKCIYLADDDFLNLVEYRWHMSLKRTVIGLLRAANLVVVGSAEMANAIRLVGVRPLCIKPFFDFTLIDGVGEGSIDNEIRVGYSSLRWEDLVFLSKSLIGIMESHDNFFLELFGYQHSSFRGNKRVRILDNCKYYPSFIGYQRSRCWTIGLAPLLKLPGRFSKTNNKYREYGALGIPGIYQDAPPYSDCVVNFESGILVDNDPTSWVLAIQELVNNHGLRKKIIKSARYHIESMYTLDVVLSDWQKVIDSLGSDSVDFGRYYRRSLGLKNNLYINKLGYSVSAMAYYFDRLCQVYKYDGMRAVYSVVNARVSAER